MLKKVKVDEATGMVLGHDVTKIVPGIFKGPAFRRGHIIREEDVPDLLNIGKEHVYVMELGENEVHEEEAARRIATAIRGSGIEISEPREGRVNLKAKVSGVLRINRRLLKKINSDREIIVVTLHNNTVCHDGMTVAATKIIPLFTGEDRVHKVEQICQGSGKVVEVTPFVKREVGVVITGNEVYKGRIEDKFGAVMKKKMGALGSVIIDQTIVPDDAEVIARTINGMRDKGSKAIVVCGGLSVDPDDVTAEGVKKSGARILSYGAPVMPGAMLLFAMLGDIPVIGAPACVIYNQATIFDLILPRVLAGERIRRQDIADLGHGGLCLNCEKCSFPVCPFGK
jgi:molybdopterin biosynthesis enzyme